MQTIIISGMPERTVNAFCLAFKQDNNRYGITTTPDEKAVHIVDIDGYTGGYAQFLLDVSTDSFLIIGLSNSYAIPDEQFLAKPLKLSALFSKLDAITAKKLCSTTGLVADASLLATDQSSPLDVKNSVVNVLPEIRQAVHTYIPNPIPTFKMSDGLLGHILAIIQDKSNTVIMFNDVDYWAIDILADSIYMSDNVNSIERGLDQSSLCRLRHFAPSDSDLETVKPLSAVLWDLAYITSAGRIPNDLTPTSLLSLYKWPNLTRLTVRQNTLRICAFMSRTPCNMLILTKMLNLDYNEVFGLLSSLQAIGLLRVVNREAAQAIREATKTTGKAETAVNIQKRGFLSKLLAKIKGV